jgi:hypothetical protein
MEKPTIRCRCINPKKTAPHLTDYTPSWSDVKFYMKRDYDVAGFGEGKFFSQ